MFEEKLIKYQRVISLKNQLLWHMNCTLLEERCVVKNEVKTKQFNQYLVGKEVKKGGIWIREREGAWLIFSI